MPQVQSSLIWNALLGVLWPAGTTVAILAAGRALATERPARAALPGMALGLGFGAGYVAIQGWPPFTWDLTIRQWLPYVGVGLALFGLYEARAGGARGLARALLSVLLPVLLLEFQRERHWGRMESVLWTGGLAALVFASWQGIAGLERRAPDAWRGLALAITTALAATAYGLSGSAQIGQLGAAVATSAGLCALAGLRSGRAGLEAGGTGVFVALYQGILWCAKFISELSWISFALLGLAPLLVLVPAPRKEGVSRALTFSPLLLAGLAVLLEFLDQPEPYGS